MRQAAHTESQSEALGMTDTLDEAYNEYLWGEQSPRAFARKTKFGGTEKISTRYSNGVPR